MNCKFRGIEIAISLYKVCKQGKAVQERHETRATGES